MLDTIFNLGALGLVALFSGILYVVLASRARYSAWTFGIVSCSIIAFEDFTKYDLYADGALQIFYVIMAFYALWEWKTTDSEGTLVVINKSRNFHLKALIFLLIPAVIVGFLLGHYTSANLPLLDTATSVMAVFATWLLVRRVQENWIYWVIIDVLYLYIYGRQGAWFYVILMLVYTIVAIDGYYKWRQIRRQQMESEGRSSI